MNAIFASKLYKASTRKDRIHAAMLAQNNLALVQQLADSLDEEFKTPENFGVEEKEEENTSVESDLFEDEEIDPEKDLVTVDDLAKEMKSGHSSLTPSSHGSETTLVSDNSKDESESETDTSDLMPDSPMTEETKAEPAKEEKPTEASTKVTSSTEVQINPVPAEAIDLNVLKATLNNRSDLAGVSRVAQKENEIWIYYNDEVNLNSIMTDVIEFLMNTTEYKTFIFNRLARSDNAIVFVIELQSYTYPNNAEED